jgi:hypothetical protein
MRQLFSSDRLFPFLLIICVLHLLFRVYGYRESYMQQFDAKYWEKRYNESQWVIPNSKNPIGDDGLFTYTAWKYIQGEDPQFLVPEYPPLGKYILGITILIFNNQNIFALLSGLFVLITFYKLNKLLFVKNNILAFVPVLLFSLEPLFYTQLRAPFFDLLYLLLLLLTFYFFLQKRFLFAALFLGCFASIKFPVTVGLIVVVQLLYLISQKETRQIRKYLLILPLVGVIYVLSYLRFFVLGHSFFDFLALQKYIINFYAIGAKAVHHSVWEMIMTGNWPTWFGTTQRVDEWQITWPLLLLSFIYTSIHIIRKKTLGIPFFIQLWVVGYLLFLSVVPVFPRYLLLILPFLYNLTIWVISLRATKLRLS